MSNLVLLVVDTLRDKDLEEKGDDIAPFLSRIGEEQIKVDNYFSNASWTAPAHASIFTGELPSEHGVNTQKPFFRSRNKLAVYLGDQGYSTTLLTENRWFSSFSGFEKGFDQTLEYRDSFCLKGETWSEVWDKDSSFENRFDKYYWFLKKSLLRKDFTSIMGLLGHVKEKFSRKTGLSHEADYNPLMTNKLLQDAKTFLASEQDYFLFMNIMPVHAPYSFDSEEKKKYLEALDEERLDEVSGLYSLSKFLEGDKRSREFYKFRKKAYISSIAYADKKIKNLYDSASEDTIFMVIGDHGELTGEYDFNGRPMIGHHLGTFKELIDVPCYIFSKGAELDIDLSSKKFYDHRDIMDIVKLLQNEDVNPGRDYSSAEYHGLDGLLQFRDEEISGEIESILRRKSFSLINTDVKYDITSDGEFTWSTADLTEQKVTETAGGLKEKGKILYSHYFED